MEFVLGADLPTLRERFHIADEAHGCGDAEISLEQQFLELLERALFDTTAGNDGDVGERDVLYPLPERLLLAGALN